jgi:hypothetical protein
VRKLVALQRLQRKYAKDVAASDVLEQKILTAHDHAVQEAHEMLQLRQLIK